MTLQETLTRLRDENLDFATTLHACATGDCPHLYQDECDRALKIFMFDTAQDLLLPVIEKMKLALEFYGDSFKIMDHIHGTYEIENDWYFKAREALSELKKLEEGLGK